MAENSQDRLNRLADEAQRLDDMIREAAGIQKRIVEEIRQIARANAVETKAPSATPKDRRVQPYKRRRPERRKARRAP
jgi:hypothetical protein